jgi:hypothetical protein
MPLTQALACQSAPEPTARPISGAVATCQPRIPRHPPYRAPNRAEIGRAHEPAPRPFRLNVAPSAQGRD